MAQEKSSALVRICKLAKHEFREVFFPITVRIVLFDRALMLRKYGPLPLLLGRRPGVNPSSDTLAAACRARR